MRHPKPTPLALLAPMLAALALALTVAAASAAAPGPASRSHAASVAAPPAPLTPTQQHYLSLAQSGVAQAKARWSDKRLGWYDSPVIKPPSFNLPYLSADLKSSRPHHFVYLRVR